MHIPYIHTYSSGSVYRVYSCLPYLALCANTTNVPYCLSSPQSPEGRPDFGVAKQVAAHTYVPYIRYSVHTTNAYTALHLPHPFASPENTPRLSLSPGPPLCHHRFKPPLLTFRNVAILALAKSQKQAMSWILNGGHRLGVADSGRWNRP